MGALYRDLLQERGHHVSILEKGESYSQDSVKGYDVILLAVPMDVACHVAQSFCPLLGPEQLILDINSLKKAICDVMSTTKAQALGTHPMFGPTVRSFEGQKIAVCRVHDGELTDFFLSELKSLKADIVEASPEEHDRMMAVVQVLTHFSKIAVGDALRQSGIDLARTLGFTSPIYRLEFSVIGRLFAQSPELYREIVMSNPYSKEIRDLFVHCVTELNAIIDGHEERDFSTHFLQDKAYFSNFADDAMKLSDRIISEVLVRSKNISDS